MDEWMKVCVGVIVCLCMRAQVYTIKQMEQSKFELKRLFLRIHTNIILTTFLHILCFNTRPLNYCAKKYADLLYTNP